MKLTERKILDFYAFLKRKAQITYDKAKYKDCLQYIIAAADTAFHFYLGYKDDDLEKVLFLLSGHLIIQDDTKERNDNDCVFYDSFSFDNGGLVQQYLCALMSNGYRIIYITERTGFCTNRSDIKDQIEKYGKAKIIEIPKELDYWEKAQFVYDKIIASKAKRLFIHTMPHAAYACTAFYALPSSIRKYKINLTDHTFWLGVGFIDYSFEFRQFGMVLSERERGVPQHKQLCLPYYPIINDAPFEGFPSQAEGKVILFSGGHFYKIFDKEDTFFKISKAILDACPEVIMLFAGTGQISALNEKLEAYKIKDRFIPIGQRKDIAEVFSHSDIYMNTYPIGGGMMLLYAAQLGLPIICYRSKTTAGAEDIVCQKQFYTISDDDIPSIVQKVKHLVSDINYRNDYSTNIKNCTISREVFNKLFEEYLNTGVNIIKYDGEVDYVRHTKDINDKIAYDNINKQYQRSIVKVLGIKSLWECPIFIIDGLISVIRDGRLVKMIKNNF